MKKLLYITLALLTAGVIYGYVNASGVVLDTANSNDVTVGVNKDGLVGHWSLAKDDATTGTTNTVTNGTFDTDTNWTKQTGWTISGGTANCDGTQTGNSNLLGSATLKVGETYLFTFTVSNYSAGQVRPGLGSITGTYVSANGTYSELLTFTGSAIPFFNADADFTGSIDNVTVYNVTGTVKDKTTSNNDGVRVGTTWTTDRHGQADNALSFNGTSDYVDLSSSNFITDFGSDTKGSISLWINPSNLVATRLFYSLNKGDSATTNNFQIGINGTSGIIDARLYSSGAVISIASDSGVPAGAWSNIIITQDGTTSRMYVNGVLQTDTDSGEWFNDMSGLAYNLIGARYIGSYGYYVGSISDVRYYSGRALLQTEITRLYNDYNSQLYFNSLSKGLGGYWSLAQSDTKSSTVVADKTANSNDGTIVGATWTTDQHGQANKALNFNGSTNYVDLSSSNFLSQYENDTKGSISMWFKSDDATNKTIFSVSKGTTANNYLEAFLFSGRLTFYVNVSGLVISIQSDDDTYNTAGWTHAVITQDGTTSKMYVNGVLQAGTDSGEWFNNLSDLAYARIGNFRYNNSDLNLWDGDINDIRYYSDRALSQAEITQLYNQY